MVPSHSFFPQLKDVVVYFPQGHLAHLLQYGDADLPYDAFPCCCCQITGVDYRFPHHLVSSSSIEYHLKLEVIGIPVKQYQTTHSFIDSFTSLSGEHPVFEVTLRHSDLPDFLINYQTFTTLLQKHWKEGDHFEMEFMEE